MNKIYAGIGARKTPQDVLTIMTRKARELDSEGWTLRSGGALGADTAFELGSSRKEIYSTDRNANIYMYDGRKRVKLSKEIRQKCIDLARKFHPTPDRLSGYVLGLMARNSCQILGSDLNSPVDVVYYWTEGGKMVGGTAQALRLAQYYGVKCVWLHEYSRTNIIGL